MRRFDVSRPRSSAIAGFPVDPEFAVRPVRALARADPYRVSSLALGSLARTHVDPPCHPVTGGALLDRVGLGRRNGQRRGVRAPDDLAGFPFRTRAGDGGPARVRLSGA